MPKAPVYTALADQMEVQLIRRGPMHISKLIANLRHNATSSEVHATIAQHPGIFFPFSYEHHNGSKICARECVRLARHKESDYHFLAAKEQHIPEAKATSTNQPTSVDDFL